MPPYTPTTCPECGDVLADDEPHYDCESLAADRWVQGQRRRAREQANARQAERARAYSRAMHGLRD